MKSDSQTQAIVTGILDYLQAKKALDLLPQVIDELSRQGMNKVDPNLAVVAAPVKLNPDQVKAIQQELSKLLNRPIRIKTKIDNRIIAGFTVEVAGQIIDATINERLNEVKQQLMYG